VTVEDAADLVANREHDVSSLGLDCLAGDE
jgi:hypothetical protein